ncbi:MAG: FHA domain-containing protein [Planctomycetota bacterium]|nr:FHA domain-containing protein [Planctomycetota bacterium]
MEIGLRHNNSGEYYPLARTRVRVGSDAKCDIVLEHEGIAAEHFEIRVTNLGIEIDDLESETGTFVNEHKIDYHFLSNKDALKLGAEEYSLEFHQEKRSRGGRCERCGVELDERSSRKVSRSILATGASQQLCNRCEEKQTTKKDASNTTSIFNKLQHLHSATRKFTKSKLDDLSLPDRNAEN